MAHACSCMELPPVSEAKEQADAVFSGEVTSIQDKGVRREVTIDIQEAWKGVERNPIKIFTGFNSGDCGLPIEIGESYLFYATDFGEGEDNVFLTSTICSRTTKMAAAMQDIKELGAGKKKLIQSEPASSSDRQFYWSIPSLLGTMVLLVIISWIVRKKRSKNSL